MPAPWRSAFSTRFESACSSRRRSASTTRSSGACDSIRRPYPWLVAEAGRDRVEQLAHSDLRRRSGVRRRRPGRGGAGRRRAGRACRSPRRPRQRRRRARGADSRLCERELDLGLDSARRSPQLVAGVGDEAPLALERGLEAGQHLVQPACRAGRSRRRRRHRQPPAGSRRRSSRPARSSARPGAGQRREQVRRRARRAVARSGRRRGAAPAGG